MGDSARRDGLAGRVGQRWVAAVFGQGDQRERPAAAGGVDEVRGAFLADSQPASLGDAEDLLGEDFGCGRRRRRSVPKRHGDELSEVLERPIASSRSAAMPTRQYGMTEAWAQGLVDMAAAQNQVSTTPSRASRSPPAFASGVRKCSDQPSWPEHHPGHERPAEQIGRHALEITALSLPLGPAPWRGLRR